MSRKLRNVDEYRREHESDVEWNLRRHFIVAHCDLPVTENRLMCLANCFINVHCYGCRYPEPVMRLLNELSEPLSGVLTKYHSVSHVADSIQFVKGQH